MRRQTTILAASLLFPVLFIAACQNVISMPGDEAHSSEADKRLESLMRQLPTPSGAVLVERVNASTGGQMPECAGRQTQVFFGTNDLSFEEVLAFYATTLQAQGWQLRSAGDHGRSFSMGDEFTADVSDLYDVSYIGQDTVQEGKDKFRTVYLLGLYTSVLVPAPPQCK